MMDQIARSAEQLGSILARARVAREETQKTLGERIATRQPTISSLEQGREGTRLSTLFEVLAALNLEIVVRPRQTNRAEKLEDLF